MRFEETGIPGLFVIDLQPIGDERGFFARSFCQRELQNRGLNPKIAQINQSYSRQAGTFRGLHYQTGDAAETKIVRCTVGSIFDVVVDLRPDSPTYKKSYSVTLSAADRRALYIPGMFAQGYLTLEDHTEVSYSVSEFYSPESERGLRFNDSIVRVEWPIDVVSVSDKDKAWPAFAET